MKKLLFFILTFISVKSNAQSLYPFPQPGLEQVEIYHGDWTTGGYPYNGSFKYSGDTLYSGYTYARFEKFSNPGIYFHTYYDNGKVYYFNYGSGLDTTYTSGRILYDFSMIVGDSINLGSYPYNGYYTVDSVGSILLLNGQTRKFMRLTNGFNTLQWIDGIGDIEHGIIYEADFEGGYEEFVCHRDSTGDVYKKSGSTFDCDPENPVFVDGSVSCGMFTYTLNTVGTYCSFVCTGEISVSGTSGGAGAYQYSIDGGTTFTTSSTFTGLCPGSYAFVVMDALGNSCEVTVLVPLENTMYSTATVTHASCNGACDGQICMNSFGGVTPYSYGWSTGETTNCIDDVCAGTYSFCVTDVNGCSACTLVVVTEPTPIVIAATEAQASCFGCCDGDLVLAPSGSIPPYTILYTSGPPPPPGGFCPGMYTFCVTDSIGCEVCDSAEVSYNVGVIPVTAQIFKVIPNPFTETLTVISTGEFLESIEVITVEGKIIYKETGSCLVQQTIITGNWDAGIYFLQLSFNGSRHTQKLIKE